MARTKMVEGRMVKDKTREVNMEGFLLKWLAQ